MRNQFSSLKSLKPGTKVLFACVPADGHFNPLTGLARYLANRGCDVRWYTSVHYAPKLRALGIPHYPLHAAFDIAASQNPEELFPERAQHRSQLKKLVFDLIHVFTLRAPEYYDDLKAIRTDFEFEALVCDITFGAIPFVTDKMGIPCFAMGIIPLTETSRDLPPAGLGLTPSASFLGRRRQDVMRFVADNFLFAKPNKVLRHLLARHGISAPGSNIFDIMTRKATLVFQSGTPGFEYRRSDMGRNIRFVGALLPHRSESVRTPWFDERLNRFEKVVLVTQGTVEKDIEKLLAPVLAAFQNSEYLVVATTGGSGTHALRDRFPAANLIIEDFIPFGDVMPYADVYVSNGGYGGVMLGLEHALPMVVAGVHEGKNEINARIGYFGLGINLKTETPNPVQIRKAVETVLADSSYAAKARELSEEFARYPTLALCESHMAEIIGAATPVTV
ncbi:glycosyltransferase [Flaviaesturariibacter amylovorans]|uniref:Glycosyltransferase n=1 Tax=Flaviaesturariibacter amylovorans TaxID=1084520 RepID=A0ABP8GIW1_9BACT